ncbi:aldehyde dehydrogenase family protein, partial [Escherichia coli]|nr:aldehyde dehydrogenase family protein [Escherichia coli]
FSDIFDYEDEYLDKCIEGTLLGFFNQGEVCTCPSRVLVHEAIYDKFVEKRTERAQLITQGNPLDADAKVGVQTSQEQFAHLI